MIGTITFHWGTNYGAVIQAYSLQKAIQNLGYKTEIIDYKPRRLIVLRYLSALKAKDFALLKKEIKLKQFRNKHLVCSNQRYSNNRELFNISDQYTHIIVGSDQIWNYSFTMGAENRITLSYFLNFAGDNTKRISYAASFGSDMEPEDYIKTVTPWIAKFASISVREVSGLGIVEKFGCKGQVVCDPTLLLTKEDYKKLIGDSYYSKKYIYSYVLHKNQRNADAVIAGVKSIYPDYQFVKDSSEGIIDWLRRINNADLVITNSLHGLMFSLIFNTPFIVVPVSGSSMNGRIYTILEAVNAVDRIIDGDRLSDLSNVLKMNLNWDNINRKMNELRTEGLLYLKNNLT